MLNKLNSTIFLDVESQVSARKLATPDCSSFKAFRENVGTVHNETHLVAVSRTSISVSSAAASRASGRSRVGDSGIAAATDTDSH